MQFLDMVLKKSDVLSAEEYLKLYTESPDSIATVRVIPPRIGVDNHFGKFEVFYSSNHYEVMKHGIPST